MNWKNKDIKDLFDKAPDKGIPEPTIQDWEILQKKLHRKAFFRFGFHDNNKYGSISMTNYIFKYAAIFIVIIGISGLIYYLINSQKGPGISKNQALINTDSIKRLDKTNEKKYFSKDNKRTDIEKPIKKDSSASPSIQHDALALNMQESVIFENLVAANYRNNMMEVLSPLLNQQFTTKQEIVFKFTGDFSTPLVIKIYNNKGTRIYKTNAIQTNSYTLDIKLYKGLYYWKLERNTNLIHVGKFIVK